MDRRHFLTTLSAGCLSPLLLTSPAWAVNEPSPKFKNLFVIMATGGWDTTWVFDPKPDSSYVDTGTGDWRSRGALRYWGSSARPNVDAFFANHGESTAIINGIQVRSIAHLACRRRILTGSTSDSASDFATIVGGELGTTLPVPHLILGNTAFPGALGAETVQVGFTNQIQALLDDTQAFPERPGLPHPSLRVRPAEQALTRTFIQERVEALRTTRSQSKNNEKLIQDYVRSYDRAQALKNYSDSFGNRGVTLDLGAQLSLAIEAVENGLTQTVTLEDRQPWDTHQNITLQGIFLDNLFGALDTFIETLKARNGNRGGSLFDESLVVVMSEMSRTPRLNFAGGKDHWPYTSAMVIGPSVKSQVLGATDERLEGLSTEVIGASGAMQSAPLLAETLTNTILKGAGVETSGIHPGQPSLDLWTP